MSVLSLLRKVKFLSASRRIELYPPFFFMRVKVIELADDWSIARFKLPLNACSKNMGHSMFGGNQASLADPIAAMACAARFPGYSIWTRAMHIDFIKEGIADLELRFEFKEPQFKRIQAELAETQRCTPKFEYAYFLPDGTLCSKVVNTVAIRPKGYVSPSKS